MVVIAIIGLVCAMGLPNFLHAMQKHGMIKMINDLETACSDARSHAIIKRVKTPLIFYPAENKFEVGFTAQDSKQNLYVIPDGVTIEMLDVFRQDYLKSDAVRVFFYPDGTCDELDLTFKSKAGEFMQATADWATSSLRFKHLN